MKKKIMKKDNITLIGMPGSGKSTISKLLAKKLNFDFIDTDEYIAKQEKMSPQQIVDTKGDKGFLKIEKKRILELLPLKKYIISPGGCVVYLTRVMSAIKGLSLIVFLDLPLDVLEKRLINQETRGMIWLESKSLKELYIKRSPLYKKYADITINCFQKSDKQIVQEIIKKLTPLKRN